jgi:hypothetical protein
VVRSALYYSTRRRHEADRHNHIMVSKSRVEHSFTGLEKFPAWHCHIGALPCRLLHLGETFPQLSPPRMNSVHIASASQRQASSADNRSTPAENRFSIWCILLGSAWPSYKSITGYTCCKLNIRRHGRWLSASTRA